MRRYLQFQLLSLFIPTTVAALFFCCILLSGCGGKSDAPKKSLRESYARINSGMSLTQVEAILGSGRPLTLSDDLELHIKDAPPGSSTVWQDDETSITVAFIEGKAVAKARAIAPARRK